MELKGYAGSILYVDLERHSIEKRSIEEKILRQYLGGTALASYLLYKEITPGVDPFDPRNVIVYSTGVLTGSIIPSTCKLSVVTKSPLTGYYTESNASGSFGAELKYAGYDAVVVKGASAKPVYIWIENDCVEIRDAKNLWGLKTCRLWDAIRDEVDDNRAQIVNIGPAGENLVRFSSTLAGPTGKGAAGRGGTGAVAGSKKLKAVAVRGTNAIEAADIEGCASFAKECLRRVREEDAASSLIAHGTQNLSLKQSTLGLLGSYNWQKEQFEGADLLTGDEMVRRGLRKADKACFSCPLRCRKLSVVNEGAYKGAFTEGPEYETLFAMGSMCGNSCIESLIMADRLCSDYGMDTISTGATIAFAMELYQRGIITRKDTDDLDLTWGNHEAQIELIRKIGEREGFGDILAEGSLRAAKKIGKGAERYSMTVMGQEIPGHSPRGVKTLAAAYVLSPRGATHNDLPAYWDYGAQEETYKGKGKMMAERLGESGSGSRFNYVGICRMPYGPEVEYMLEAIKLVTGWNLSLDELKLIAKRDYSLKRAFNLREGVKREHSVLPERMMTEPIPAGPLKGHVTPKEMLDIIVDEFYLAMGWDPSTGIPKEETMRSLDLEWVLKDLDMPDKP